MLTFLIPNKIFSQDLSLPNGKYKIEYDEQFRNHPGYNFTIKDNEITFHEIQGDITRRIEKNSDCSLRIEKEKIDESTLTEFQKIINKQHPYYSFTKINNGEFKFIYRIDLHVMINSGKFIKIGQ
ncbi:MAG: hypothetical protein L6264_04170 [Weeksellaceae bacterium]|nr:hypothetical protein [Bacteroidota bacterium]MCG2780121.1 hypothetical protein [Weeksellaceae bacterium]